MAARHVGLLNVEVCATERQNAGPIAGLAVVGSRLFSAGQDQRILSFEPLPKGPLHYVGPELRATTPFVDLRATWWNDLETIVVVAACRDQDVRVWEILHGAEVGETIEHKLCGHVAPVRSVDLHGSFALSASDDETARVWDLHSSGEIVALGHPGPVARALFFPGSSQLATQCLDGATRIWDLRESTNRPICVIVEAADAAGPGSLDLCQSGRLALGSRRGQVRLYDVPRLGARCESSLRLPDAVSSMQFVLDGRYLACACGDGDLHIVRLEGLVARRFQVQAAEGRGGGAEAPHRGSACCDLALEATPHLRV